MSLLQKVRWYLWNRHKQEHREYRFLDRALENLRSDDELRNRTNQILKYKPNDFPQHDNYLHEERELPGDPKNIESGWSKWMLARYAIVLKNLEGKVVIDTCSGIGWGSYLMDSKAREVVAVDVSAVAIELSKTLWPTKRTDFIQASVMNLPFKSNSFDVVTAMESIEHFTYGHILRYFDEIVRVIKPGGRLWGSSSFPKTILEARTLQKMNPYHLHICTEDELKDILSNRFTKYHIFKNRMYFWAEK